MNLEDYLRAIVKEEAEKNIQSDAPFESPGLKLDGADAVITGPLSDKEHLSTVEETLRARGLNPDDWIVERTVVNVWETTSFVMGEPITKENHQLKIFLRSKAELVLPRPALTDGPIYHATEPYHNRGYKTYAILSDFQIPYHDEFLVQLTCNFLSDIEVDGIIINGDYLNGSAVSKYKTDPQFNAALNEEVDKGYGILRDLIEAVGPNCTYRKFIDGNHEQRLADIILAKVPQLYGLHRGGESLSVLSIPYLLRLEELGFEYVVADNGATYPHAGLVLPDTDMLVTHGFNSGRGGTGSYKSTKDLGCSFVQGHDHTQAIQSVTIPGAFQHGTRRWAVSGGCMCSQDQGYNNIQNLDQGFVIVRVQDGGGFYYPSLVSYFERTLMWEDRIYI